MTAWQQKAEKALRLVKKGVPVPRAAKMAAVKVTVLERWLREEKMS